MSQEIPETKMRSKEVTDAFVLLTDDLFKTVPELRSVAIVLDWEIGQNDFPFGVMVGRNGSVTSPVELHNIMLQTAKMCRHQSEVMLRAILTADEIAGEIAKRIEEMTKKLESLESNHAAKT